MGGGKEELINTLIFLLEGTKHVPCKYKVTMLSQNCSSWVGVNVAFMTCIVWDTRSSYVISTEVYIYLTGLHLVWLDDLITVSFKNPGTCLQKYALSHPRRW
jgi:hypothetical protein